MGQIELQNVMKSFVVEYAAIPHLGEQRHVAHCVEAEEDLIAVLLDPAGQAQLVDRLAGVFQVSIAVGFIALDEVLFVDVQSGVVVVAEGPQPEHRAVFDVLKSQLDIPARPIKPHVKAQVDRDLGETVLLGLHPRRRRLASVVLNVLIRRTITEKSE